MAEFTIYEDRAGEYSGEGYTTNQGCRDAIERVKKGVASAAVNDTTR